MPNPAPPTPAPEPTLLDDPGLTTPAPEPTVLGDPGPTTPAPTAQQQPADRHLAATQQRPTDGGAGWPPHLQETQRADRPPPYIGTPAPQPYGAPQPPYLGAPPPPSGQRQRRRVRWPLIGLIVGLAVILAAVVIALVFMGNRQLPPNPVAPTNPPAPTTSEPPSRRRSSSPHMAVDNPAPWWREHLRLGHTKRSECETPAWVIGADQRGQQNSRQKASKPVPAPPIRYTMVARVQSNHVGAAVNACRRLRAGYPPSPTHAAHRRGYR